MMTNEKPVYRLTPEQMFLARELSKHHLPQGFQSIIADYIQIIDPEFDYPRFCVYALDDLLVINELAAAAMARVKKEKDLQTLSHVINALRGLRNIVQWNNTEEIRKAADAYREANCKLLDTERDSIMDHILNLKGKKE